MSKFVICILVLVILTGCQGAFERSGEEIVSPRSTRADDKPLGLKEDKLVVPEEIAYVAADDSSSISDSTQVMYPIYNQDEGNLSRTESFQVQLFTSKTYGPAVRELNIAREVFDHQVQLAYEVPYYKIRVGDFATRDDAEKYIPAAKEAGYSNAWTVKINLNLKKLENMYDNLELPPESDSSNIIDPELMEPLHDSTLYQED